MAVELEKLIDEVKHMDITQIAGNEGIHNRVNWVHMVENVEATDFLHGREIVFTTGIGINSEEDLFNLVKSLNARNAAGVIVNIGPFIEGVPPMIIDYCNENNFPLFVVPWKVHLAEIMRIFCYRITKDDQSYMEIASAFKNAIYFPQREDLYIVPLSQHNFNASWSYSVCILHLKTKNENPSSRVEGLSINIDNFLQHYYENTAVFFHENKVIIVFANHKLEKIREVIATLQKASERFLSEGEEIVYGIGRLTKSIRCIYKSYNQAAAIIKLQEANKVDKSMIFFADMGLFRLLMAIEDKDILIEYYNQVLSPLIDYDKSNNSDLCLVLKSYLDHNGSVKDTAEELFVHRNTVNYKLNKIEEILCIDLSLLSERLQLAVAFLLKDMI